MTGLVHFELPAGFSSSEEPIYLLGMLHFFETKNIRHKPARAQLFHAHGDALGEHDMDFDEADKTIRAGNGKPWLKERFAIRGQDSAAHDQVLVRGEKLVSDSARTATGQEVIDLKQVAGALIAKSGGSVVI